MKRIKVKADVIISVKETDFSTEEIILATEVKLNELGKVAFIDKEDDNGHSNMTYAYLRFHFKGDASVEQIE